MEPGINQEDIATITLKISTLKKELKLTKKGYDEQISLLAKGLRLCLEGLEEVRKITHIHTDVLKQTDDREKLKQVIIFQRNIYKK